jgi:hypothetical protein
MAIREVVRFICDDTDCKHLPPMTEDEAIRHVERHISFHTSLYELLTIWNVA